MNFFRSAATAFASLSLLAPLVAPAQAARNPHVVLLETVQAAGVSVLINPDWCHEQDPADGDIYGFYAGGEGLMVICPEEARKGEEAPAWTEEDLDTLRHEAHHLLQDCMDGVLSHSLRPALEDPVGFASDILGEQTLINIARVYGRHGASEETIVLEFEAFAVAAMDRPDLQIQEIKRFCPQAY